MSIWCAAERWEGLPSYMANPKYLNPRSSFSDSPSPFSQYIVSTCPDYPPFSYLSNLSQSSSSHDAYSYPPPMDLHESSETIQRD